MYYVIDLLLIFTLYFDAENIQISSQKYYDKNNTIILILHHLISLVHDTAMLQEYMKYKYNICGSSTTYANIHVPAP